MDYPDKLYNWQSKKERKEKGIYEVPVHNEFYYTLATAVSKIKQFTDMVRGDTEERRMKYQGVTPPKPVV